MRKAAFIAGLVVCALVIFVLSRHPDEGHRVALVMPEASGVVAGQLVRQGGAVVGRVDDVDIVDRGSAARVDLSIQDMAWPLPRGTRMTLRWSGTVNLRSRYFRIDPGPATAPALPEGAVLESGAVSAPQEFDKFLAAFPRATRRDVGLMLQRLGNASKDGRGAFRRTLDRSPAALSAASGVLGQLNADKQALGTLVTSADNVLGAVDRARPGTRELLTGAAQTFSAVAQESDGLESTLELAPATLSRTRELLGQARPALDDLGVVSRRLRPGAKEARRIAAPLNRLLVGVGHVGPAAKTTVEQLTTAAPRLSSLLTKADDVAPEAKQTLEESVEALRCMRPFTPEIAAFFSTWSDFTAAADATDKLFRAQVQNFLPAGHNANAITPAQAKRLYPQLTYGFPRPPGTSAGQPWFIPECNVTQAALDPARDPEAAGASTLGDGPRLRPVAPRAGR